MLKTHTLNNNVYIIHIYAIKYTLYLGVKLLMKTKIIDKIKKYGETNDMSELCILLLSDNITQDDIDFALLVSAKFNYTQLVRYLVLLHNANISVLDNYVLFNAILSDNRELV